ATAPRGGGVTSLRVPLPTIPLGTIKEAWREFRPALSGQSRRLVWSFVLSGLGTGLELLRPWPIKFVFDRVLVPLSKGKSSATHPELTIALAAAAVLVVSLVLAQLDVRSTMAAAEVSRSATVSMRRRVFEHLHGLAFPFHQSSRTGDLLVRLMGDVNMVRDLLFASWLTMIERGLLVVGVTVVMFLVNPWLALIALAPLPMLAVVLTRRSKRLRAAIRKQRRREGDAAAYAAETPRQVRLVKAYAAEGRATERSSSDSARGALAGLEAARIEATMGRPTEVVTGRGQALVLSL